MSYAVLGQATPPTAAAPAPEQLPPGVTVSDKGCVCPPGFSAPLLGGNMCSETVTTGGAKPRSVPCGTVDASKPAPIQAQPPSTGVLVLVGLGLVGFAGLIVYLQYMRFKTYSAVAKSGGWKGVASLAGGEFLGTSRR